MDEQWQSFTSMFTKLAQDLKLPRVDTERLIEAHRKNIDALARSAEAASEGAKSLAVKQREIVEEASRCDDNGLAHPEFFAALAEIASNKAGGLDATRLGYWLRKVQGDVFSLPGNPTTKLRFAKVETIAHGGFAQWILKVM